MNNIPLYGCIPFCECIPVYADARLSSRMCTPHGDPVFLQPLAPCLQHAYGALLSPGLVGLRRCALGVAVPAEAAGQAWPSGVHSSPCCSATSLALLGTVKGAATLSALTTRHWPLSRLQPWLRFSS